MNDIDIKALAKRAASALDLDNGGAKKRKVQKKEDGRIGKSIWKEFSKETGIELGERTIKMTVKTKDVEAAIAKELENNPSLLDKIMKFFGWDKKEEPTPTVQSQSEVAGSRKLDFGEGISYDYQERKYTFTNPEPKIVNHGHTEQTIKYEKEENPTSGTLQLKEITGGENPCYGSYSMYKFDVTVPTGENIGNLPELKNYKEMFYYNANTDNYIFKLDNSGLSISDAVAQLKIKGYDVSADDLAAANKGIMDSNGKLSYNDIIVPKGNLKSQLN